MLEYEPKFYRVRYEIDIDGASPSQAAATTLQWLREGSAAVFTVWEWAEGADAPDLTIEPAQVDFESVDAEALAVTGLTALAPEMWKAIQGALRIADLWRPGEFEREHWEEARALHTMLCQFEEVARKVAKTEGQQDADIV